MDVFVVFGGFRLEKTKPNKANFLVLRKEFIGMRTSRRYDTYAMSHSKVAFNTI
jgi:hypothetical protein